MSFDSGCGHPLHIVMALLTVGLRTGADADVACMHAGLHAYVLACLRACALACSSALVFRNVGRES
eukprot:1525463-Alexandrium_andersonii.AAC.1